MELNECTPRKIEVKGPYTFSIGDCSDLSDYTRGGIVTQVKMPTSVHFVSSSYFSLTSLFILDLVIRSLRYSSEFYTNSPHVCVLFSKIIV